jgi:hypothetical protein
MAANIPGEVPVQGPGASDDHKKIAAFVADAFQEGEYFDVPDAALLRSFDTCLGQGDRHV